MNHPLCSPDEHHFSRRRWLGSAAGGAIASGAMAVAGSPLHALVASDELNRRDKQVLFVWIDGGMSQFESWDPKPGTRFGGPFRSIPTTLPGLHLSELMPQTARQMHHLAVVRSLCTQDNSHSAGVPRILRGDPKNRGVTYPYFGSAIARLMGSGQSKLPPYVWIKPGSGGFKHENAGFLGPRYGALAFGDGQPPENLTRDDGVTAEDQVLRYRIRSFANDQYVSGRHRQNTEASGYVFDLAQTLMERQDLFDATQLNPRDIQRYGTHEFGRHMLLGRRMLEAGVRFVQVTSYGWDTHGDNFNGHASLMPRFDQAFAAMIEDLHDRGMLEHVLVVCLSEFGRTPKINGHVGRDHWPESWSIAMAGSGIRSGTVVGETNAEGTAVATEEYDIGHLFHTWFRALGIDSVAVQYDNAGQPLPIAHDDCFAVREVLSV
ncbi:MAG: DUF1501 domain-containing protein [Planctomycetaceae bacterium]|nr:DUF1501 domain-containing protein [Planctomycetaceae bacterium]